MIKFDALVKKYGIIFDCIILVLCAFLVIYPIQTSSLILSEYIFIKQTTVYNILLVMAVIKMFVCLDISDQRTIGAIVLLAMSVIFKHFGLGDCTFLIIPMVALYGVNFRTVAKVFASTAIFGLIVILISSLTGIIQNATVERPDSVRGAAYQLGFEHHNWFMMYWLFAMFAMIYIFKKNKLRVLLYMVFALITIALWLITDSNTSGIIGVAVCIVMIIDYLVHMVVRKAGPTLRGIQKGLLKLTIVMPVLAVILTFLGCVYFGHFGYQIFPETMLSRFYLADAALEALGVNLPFSVTVDRWDVPFSWLTGTGQAVYINGYSIDNVYAKLLIENGYIILIPYIILQMFVRYKLYKSNQYVLALICAAISIFGILESRAFTTYACALFSMLLFTRIPVKARKRRRPK